MVPLRHLPQIQEGLDRMYQIKACPIGEAINIIVQLWP